MFGHTLILHQLPDTFEVWQLFFCIEKERRTNYLVRQPLFHTQKPFSKPQETAESEGYMAFFNSAVNVLQTLVIALGAGLGVWGVINLLEGYGNDNPGANAYVR